MNKKLMIGVLYALVTTFVSSAQECESDIPKYKNAFRSETFQLTGYGQIQYNFSEYTERSPVFCTANNSIDLSRAILCAMGKFGVKNQFGYMLMYDFSPNARLHELYGEWMPSKAISVRFGQFKIPFTIENPMSPSVIETINFSRSASAMNGSVGDFNQLEAEGKVVSKSGRDAGLQLSGLLFSKNDFFQMEYYAGLFNGTGINVKDNNNWKDFIGTVYWQPVKGFKLGGSIYTGKLYYSMNKLPASNHVRNRWTVGASYSGVYFYSRAEYLAANDGDLKRKGYYASFVWKFAPNKWEMLGKYDFYDKNRQLDNNEIQDITIGVNYYFAFLSRLQFNYIYTNDKADGKNHAAAIQLQLFF